MCLVYLPLFSIHTSDLISNIMSLRLRARSGYLSTFIVKWLTRKPYLGNRDWFAIAIHDPRYRPKGVQTLKNALKFQGSVMDGKPLRIE